MPSHWGGLTHFLHPILRPNANGHNNCPGDSLESPNHPSSFTSRAQLSAAKEPKDTSLESVLQSRHASIQLIVQASITPSYGPNIRPMVATVWAVHREMATHYKFRRNSTNWPLRFQIQPNKPHPTQLYANETLASSHYPQLQRDWSRRFPSKPRQEQWLKGGTRCRHQHLPSQVSRGYQQLTSPFLPIHCIAFSALLHCVVTIFPAWSPWTPSSPSKHRWQRRDERAAARDRWRWQRRLWRLRWCWWQRRRWRRRQQSRRLRRRQ